MKATMFAFALWSILWGGAVSARAGDLSNSSSPIVTSGAVQVSVEGNVRAQPVAYAYDGWRYRWYGNRWWYWTPNNSWVYWYGNTWVPYGGVAVYDYGYPRYYDYGYPRYYTGYRGPYYRPYAYQYYGPRYYGRRGRYW